ncbi:MDR family MFS transporter [Paenibacillus sp. VCA1]|uniref:MDR family MFS transporter n=1 Tax=Paenibacillus sp. VCA1 TaxID=3039148 RepID=UPI002871A232|nr:MDR family MFS transporter [Paenibacillus sp. VCA1]MDR9854370.1 MDR family MFS transporter [Paenibacillus sp. VCA1]
MNRSMVMISILIATFLAAAESSIVTTAMPKIVGSLQGIELMNGVFTVYLLASTVTVLIFGKLSDLYGRKLIFTVGAVFFLIGSVLCGMAQTMEQLIAFRLIQGIGAGAILPVTQTIIADIYPSEEKRARMIGLTAFVWGGAGVVGPLLGGFFVDYVSWHWIFYFNLPFGLLAILFMLIFLKEKVEKSKKTIDYPGILAFSLGMLALLFAVQKGGEGHWLSWPVLLCIAAFVVLMGLFVWIETKAAEPILPLAMFRRRQIVSSNLIQFLVNAIMMGTLVYMPLWFQGGLGTGAIEAGLMLAPLAIVWAFGSYLCGKMLVKQGMRVTSLAGNMVLVLSGAGLAAMQLSSGQYGFYLISALLGLSFGITVTLYTVVVQSAVAPSLSGVATATNSLFRSLGQMLGASVFGSYFNSRIAFRLSAEKTEDVNMGQMNRLIDASDTSQIPASLLSKLQHILVSGIHDVFIVFLGLAVVCVMATLLLPRSKQNAAKESA